MSAGPYPADPFAEDAPARAGWAVTLADLALLLAGFLVLVQATRSGDRPELARGLRERFGTLEAAAPVGVQAAALAGFAPGSAVPDRARGPALADWAAEQLRDPRAALLIAGGTDGTAADRDPATGSAAVLAADRARAAASIIAKRVPAARLRLSADAAPRGRRALVTVTFLGEQP